ncbi:response regulator [Croceicoccus marinus]|uniref:Response regulator n=1 Tax=Croceicoccus marinus TaxID=450378 RepID=A0A1Z1FD10_9SPHN|nr:response regulator [Croceicoccus marinus]ARU16606.1 response regulator [Croceicoccus marinus]
MRVLYIDDESDIREIAEIALGLDPEMEIRTAASAADALAVMEEWLPDLALLDVMMPHIDGPALLSRLRTMDRYRTLPVIFITARAQRSELHNFATMDAIGVIAKPFDPMTLAARVREIAG